MQMELENYLLRHLIERDQEVLLIRRLVEHAGYYEERDFLDSLVSRIEKDRDSLRSLCDGLGVSCWGTEHLLRKFAFVMERLKGDFAGRRVGQLGKYLTLETLSLKLEGKHLMWASLSQVADFYAAFSDFNFVVAMADAKYQRDEVEKFREREVTLVF